jgi:hypothetical protein
MMVNDGGGWGDWIAWNELLLKQTNNLLPFVLKSRPIRCCASYVLGEIDIDVNVNTNGYKSF